MAWIESHQSLAKHKKLLRLSGLLKVNRVYLVGHLHYLWWWGLDNADIDGRLGDVTAFEIAEAAEWDGDPDEFVSALVEAGFLKLVNGEYVLHDWYDYAGKLNERREKERERSRQRRSNNQWTTAQRPPDDRATTAGRPQDDQQTTAGTKPNLTQPNQPIDYAHTGEPAEAEETHVPEPDELERTLDELVRLYEQYSPVSGKQAVGARVRRRQELGAALRAGCSRELLEEVIREQAPLDMPPWELRKEAIRRAGFGATRASPPDPEESPGLAAALRSARKRLEESGVQTA